MAQEGVVFGGRGVAREGWSGAWGQIRRKRVFDVVVGAILLALGSPLFALIGLAIKLDSRGSVFFRQVRIGARPRLSDGSVVWDIRQFSVFKFRSMRAASDESIHAAHVRAFVEGRLDPSHGSFKLQDDDRITRVGRVLRRTSLDELPQLINVVRGEMSLVGPRPVPPYEVDLYEDWQMERLSAMPGVTGAWQVSGQGRVTFDEMIRMDIDYVRRHSFLGDLKLLAQTVPAILSGAGAE